MWLTWRILLGVKGESGGEWRPLEITAGREEEVEEDRKQERAEERKREEEEEIQG